MRVAAPPSRGSTDGLLLQEDTDIATTLGSLFEELRVKFLEWKGTHGYGAGYKTFLMVRTVEHILQQVQGPAVGRLSSVIERRNEVVTWLGLNVRTFANKLTIVNDGHRAWSMITQREVAGQMGVGQMGGMADHVFQRVWRAYCSTGVLEALPPSPSALTRRRGGRVEGVVEAAATEPVMYSDKQLIDLIRSVTQTRTTE